jgi:glutathione S-transferase
MPGIELLQFPYSHYNEKLRWALDWKGIRHRRTNLLPGPHARRIKKLAPETTVPVVRLDGQVVQGSARILDEIERRHPEPALHPVDPALRARAREIQCWPFSPHREQGANREDSCKDAPDALQSLALPRGACLLRYSCPRSS